MSEEHLTPEDWSGLVIEEVEEVEEEGTQTQESNLSQYTTA